MKLFVTIYNDARLLGHFLRHYAGAGVTHFFIAVPPEFAMALGPFMDRYNITRCDGLDVADSILGGVAAVSEMRRRHQRANEWVVLSDLDEFIEFDDDIARLIAAADRMRANVIRGIMLDRFSLDGQPRDFAPDEDLSVTYPIKSRFIRNIMDGCDHKGILVKGYLKPAAAHHRFEGERTFDRVLEISHYKWIGGSLDRLRVSHQIILDAGISWAMEHRRVFAHFEKYGRFAWETFGGRLAEEFQLEAPSHCKDCGGAISEAEDAYSLDHFGIALCRTDQDKRRAA
jgi:hypothetical protein